MSKFISNIFIAALFVGAVPVAFFVGTFPTLYVIGSLEEGHLLTLEEFSFDELPSEYDAY